MFGLFRKPDMLKNSQAFGIFERMLDGKMGDNEIAAYLSDLNTRGFGAEEIYAAASALRERMTVFKGAEDAIDCCGTGGDRHGTLNISTAAAFVLAGAGLPVAKHGNRAVSSQSGSSDVLGALGINTDVPASVMQKALDQTNLCYLAAPLYHPAMKYVAKTRRKLGVRTIFNLLGPLVNPAKTRHQVIGVYDKKYCQILPPILKKLGSRHVWVVHGEDGMDEITTTASTYVADCAFDKSKENFFTLTPEQVGLQQVPMDALRGGDADYNAQAFRNLLQGERGAYRDIVLLNAAAGFIVAGRTKELKEGVKMGAKAIDEGKAFQVLEKFVRITNE